MATYSTNAYTSEVELLRSSDHLYAPFSRRLPTTNISALVDGTASLAPGQFLCESGTAGEARPLARAALTAAITTSSTVLTVDSGVAASFLIGDALYALAPWGSVTLALTWASADTATIVIDGYSLTYTAASATLATIATGLAAAINADKVLSAKVTAIASSAVVYLYSNIYSHTPTLSASEATAGDGTATASGTAFTGARSIGTVSAVDVENGDVTISAASAIALPSGAVVGILDKPLGFIVRTYTAGLTPESLGIYVGAFCREPVFPYIDDDLKAAFPMLVVE